MSFAPQNLTQQHHPAQSPPSVHERGPWGAKYAAFDRGDGSSSGPCPATCLAGGPAAGDTLRCRTKIFNSASAALCDLVPQRRLPNGNVSSCTSVLYGNYCKGWRGAGGCWDRASRQGTAGRVGESKEAAVQAAKCIASDATGGIDNGPNHLDRSGFMSDAPTTRGSNIRANGAILQPRECNMM